MWYGIFTGLIIVIFFNDLIMTFFKKDLFAPLKTGTNYIYKTIKKILTK